MDDKRIKSSQVLNLLVALLLVLVAGIFVRLVTMEPGDLMAEATELGVRAVAPYAGNAADGITTTGNSYRMGGQDPGNLARTFRTDTDGALLMVPAGPSTVTLAAGDPLPITPSVGAILRVSQAVPDTLNANANMQVGDADVGSGNAVPITDTAGQLNVRQATHDGLNVNANAQVNDADVSASNPMLSAPFQALAEQAATEIIGVDEQASQYDWSDGTQLSLGGTYSGEILNVTLMLSGTLSEAGTLLVFDADPSVTLADANLATASWLLAIGKIDVAAGDWFEENSGGTGAVATFAEPIAFHAVSSLWVAYYHEGATQWNSLAADNETLDIQVEYRRDS